ncbi:unnamed protein product [Ranitomeya imitator]|uniref:Uncharacterized protein n=2 Tax=Ranitomeya imitator TaxID=111125 RepID=A0ABN9M362_9NEOB|nr:unnamed protein product [Ranitomeya imitator]
MLQYFALTGNFLEDLPNELFFCQRLKTLKLGQNKLTSLSPKIGTLISLVRLDIKGNRLDMLPPELGSCTSLKKSGFIVEHSLLETLPLDVREALSEES